MMTQNKRKDDIDTVIIERNKDRDKLLTGVVGLLVCVLAFFGSRLIEKVDTISDSMVEMKATNKASTEAFKELAKEVATSTTDKFIVHYNTELKPVRERSEDNADRLNEVIMMLRCYDREHKRLNPAYTSEMCLHQDVK